MSMRKIWPTGWRAIVLLLVGSVMGANLMAPAVAHVAGWTHNWTQHIRPKTDARYYTKALADSRFLGDTVTVVASSGTITPGNFDAVRVDCPAGYKAIGGGPDLGNVLTMVVTSSAPVINDTRTFLTADGQNAAATGWQASARNNDSTTNYTFKVAVVCSPS